MKSERWRRVEHLYHAALERDAAERRTCLSDACAGDPSLRPEVESLLGYEDNADHFLEAPAAQAAAMMVATGQRPSLVGRQLSSYQVLSRIGCDSQIFSPALDAARIATAPGCEEPAAGCRVFPHAETIAAVNR